MNCKFADVRIHIGCEVEGEGLLTFTRDMADVSFGIFWTGTNLHGEARKIMYQCR